MNPDAVYIYTKNDGTWTQTQKITSVNIDYQHNSIAIHDDTILVHAISNKDDSNTGAVHIYTKNDGTWTQTQKIMASDGNPGNRFGILLQCIMTPY